MGRRARGKKVEGGEAEGLRRSDDAERPVEAAAPPDDGGHQGSFTVPRDAATPIDADQETPDLSYSPETGAQERGGAPDPGGRG